MNEEKVHYQISITSGQAAAFFLVLLVALGLSFFFGMKTGAVARRVPDGLSRFGASPEPTAPKEESREGESPATANAPVEEPPLGVPVKEERRAEPKSEPKNEAKAEPREEPREPAKAEPKQEAKQETRAPKAAEHGAWYVQVIATQNAATADGLAKKLRAAGFSADVSPISPPGKPQLFRVRVGPYSDHAAADAAAGKVQVAEKLKAKPIVMPAGK